MGSVGFSDFLRTIFLTQVIVDSVRFARTTNEYDLWIMPCKEMERGQILMVIESMDVMITMLLFCLYVNLRLLLRMTFCPQVPSKIKSSSSHWILVFCFLSHISFYAVSVCKICLVPLDLILTVLLHY